MEQRHSSQPVHQLPSASSASEPATGSINNLPESLPSSESFLAVESHSSSSSLQNAKRSSIHIEDSEQQSRRKRSRNSLEMEEFKFDGAENPNPQPSTPTSHETPNTTPVSPATHEAASPAFAASGDAQAPATSKIRARAMSAPDQSTMVRARQIETTTTIGRRSPNNNCCRKSNTTHKSKKSLNEPPVNLTTLRELDLKEILNNPRLRHDIYFDAALHFRPNLDGQRGQKKKAQADSYWESIIKE